MQKIRENLSLTILTQNFCETAKPLLVAVPDDEILASLCKELVLKICHTMSNDFLRHVSTLEALKNEKAVDVELSLRDEQKTFAMHTHSTFAD